MLSSAHLSKMNVWSLIKCKHGGRGRSTAPQVSLFTADSRTFTSWTRWWRSETMETATVNIVAPEREWVNTSYLNYSLTAGLTVAAESAQYTTTSCWKSLKSWTKWNLLKISSLFREVNVMRILLTLCKYSINLYVIALWHNEILPKRQAKQSFTCQVSHKRIWAFMWIENWLISIGLF